MSIICAIQLSPAVIEGQVTEITPPLFTDRKVTVMIGERPAKSGSTGIHYRVGRLTYCTSGDAPRPFLRPLCHCFYLIAIRLVPVVVGSWG
jgi:hypothetical protein